MSAAHTGSPRKSAALTIFPLATNVRAHIIGATTTRNGRAANPRATAIQPEAKTPPLISDTRALHKRTFSAIALCERHLPRNRVVPGATRPSRKIPKPTFC